MNVDVDTDIDVDIDVDIDIDGSNNKFSIDPSYLQLLLHQLCDTFKSV